MLLLLLLMSENRVLFVSYLRPSCWVCRPFTTLLASLWEGLHGRMKRSWPCNECQDCGKLLLQVSHMLLSVLHHAYPHRAYAYTNFYQQTYQRYSHCLTV